MKSSLIILKASLFFLLLIISIFNGNAQMDKQKIIVESVQYTDMMGFENDNPNGRIQQEFLFTIPSFKNPVIKKNHFSTFLLKDFQVDLLFNRVDKSNKFINYPVGTTLAGQPSNPTQIPFITTMDIFKYSNFQSGIRASILSFAIDDITINFKVGFSYLRNKPYYSDTIKIGPDSGKVAADLRSIWSFMNRYEVNISYPEDGKSIGMSLTGGIQFISLKDSYYKQFDAATVDPFDRATTLLKVSDELGGRRPSPIYYLSFLLHKDFGDESTNHLFLRFNHFYQTGNYNRLVSTNVTNPSQAVYAPAKFYNHFSQLQLGISIGLEKLFSKSTSEDDEKTKAATKIAADRLSI